MPRVTATIPAAMDAALEQSARENERFLAAEVRLAIREHLKASPRRTRSARNATSS